MNIGGVSTSASPWYFSNEESNGQVDLVLKRNDNVINLCEIKFYHDDFIVDLNYFKKLNSRIEAARPFVSKKSCIFNTLITTFGIFKNEYSNVFQNVITLNDLFK